MYCTNFLQLILLEQLCCYKIEIVTTEVIWLSSLTSGSLRCIHLHVHHKNWFILHVQCMCQSFSFLFHLPWTWFFMWNLAGVSWKADDAYPTSAPGPCSQFLVKLVESKLLIMYYFGYFMFFVVCISFPCLAFVPGLHSFVIPFGIDSFDFWKNLGSLDYSLTLSHWWLKHGKLWNKCLWQHTAWFRHNFSL